MLLSNIPLLLAGETGALTAYHMIIIASVVIIISFFFSEFAKKTNIPSVLLLIVLGLIGQLGLKAIGLEGVSLDQPLELLGIVGLIMIVLEAALELKLDREKLWPIVKALVIALISLLASTWVAALILEYFVDGMTTEQAWLYATPLSILSSAIIIPSVTGLKKKKKEFHIYESTFSDIMGIMLFYYLTGQAGAENEAGGLGGFALTVVLTLVVSFVASYIIVFIFQNIKSHTKLFLLIAVLLLLYAIGKQLHLSSLLIILIFGLVISNRKIFFQGWFSHWLDFRKAKEIYDGLHVITMETAFVVRTFFFVVFGLTIAIGELFDDNALNIIMISFSILASIYAIRFVILVVFYGLDIQPQLWIAPRGLITILLFYAIPVELEVEGFNKGVLLYIIIITSLIMTFALIADKRKTGAAVGEANNIPVGIRKWKAPNVDEE